MIHLPILATLMTVFVFFVAVNPSLAEDKVIRFELPESGIQIEFPLTPAEVEGEDATAVHHVLGSATKAKPSVKKFHVFELAESGQTIQIPMSPDEIAAESSVPNVSRASTEPSELETIQKMDRVELPESGLYIAFPIGSGVAEKAETVAQKCNVKTSDS